MKTFLAVIAFFSLFVAFVALVGHSEPPSPESACVRDWTKCADNAELANSHAWTDIQAACKIAGDDAAKYGEPKWPRIPFGTYLKGDDYKAGVAVAIENNAQFQNAFGAWAHVEVRCWYDLKNKTVSRVTVRQ